MEYSILETVLQNTGGRYICSGLGGIEKVLTFPPLKKPQAGHARNWISTKSTALDNFQLGCLLGNEILEG